LNSTGHFGFKGATRQQYPPGTQENYNSFLSRDLMMGKGKELELPEGPGGGKGSGIREADSDDRGFPLVSLINDPV
jgi:hypothetical protein